MADLQFSLSHDHALDQQLQDLLPLRERRAVQAGAYPLTERRQVREYRPGARRLKAQPVLLIALRGQSLPPLPQSSTPLPQFLQADHLGLIGIDQSDLLTIETLELGLKFLGLRPPAHVPLDLGPGHIAELRQ